MSSIRPRTIFDFIKAARRRKLAIAVPALVVMAASLVAIKRLPNVYESSTFILVESPQGDGAPVDLPRRLVTVRQQVTSRTRLEGLIRKHGLYPEMAQRSEPTDSIINQMRSDIDVEVNSTRADATDAFSISYRARDPETARDVTGELVDELIAESVQAMESEASGQADVLGNRAGELSTQLHELEMKAPWLLTLKDDSPLAAPVSGRAAGPSAEAIRAQQLTLASLRDQQYKVQQQIADLDRRIAQVRQIVDHQKKNPAPRDNPAYGELIAKRAELQGLKDNLIKKQDLTDRHPRVTAIDDQIGSINRAIAELSRQDSGSLSQTPEERDLAGLETDRSRLKVELEVTGRELGRRAVSPADFPRSRPVMDSTAAIPRTAESARMAQDYLGLKQNYKEITAKLQNAELKRQTIGSAKVERFRILDGANVPGVPVWPNRRLLALVAAGLSLVVGVCVGLAGVLRRLPSVQDARDVEHYTGLPLLASIPRTLTLAERHRYKLRARLKVAVSGAVAVLATLGLAKALLAAHLFELLIKR